MIKFYADKIERGEITIDNVPSYWKAKVQEELDRRNHIELDV